MNSKGTNHLINEKSPYLKQHAHNPVDWYPWGDKAFSLAKKLNKPIFLSIGYSTCHWCHVMAHESFENPEIAELMNRVFVNIKVDREELPDVDQLYMTVCQTMTGRGGWPLTIIMTPDRVPFYAATYIPPHGAYGRIGMKELIPQIENLWKNKRTEIDKVSSEIMDHVKQAFAVQTGHVSPHLVLQEAFNIFESAFDSVHGGFGKAPKFPSPHQFLFLLRYSYRTDSKKALQMVESTLSNMKRGGIYDHVGFGFHRYSTDAEWKLPHFEKMLYDQAMLLMAYSEAAMITGKNDYKQTVQEIFEYLTEKLLSEKGAFYAAEDADSDGEEGKFYFWTIKELRKILNESEYRLFKHLFAVEQEGNFHEEATDQFTGANVLFRATSDRMVNQLLNISDAYRQKQWESIRIKLKQYRENRPHPGLDNKILTDWNGLLIAGLAMAGRLPGNKKMIDAAGKVVDFIDRYLSQPDGSLWHSYTDGISSIPAKLNDYAFLIWGLTELYQVTFNDDYLLKAIELTNKTNQIFFDKASSMYYMSEEKDPYLITRPVEMYDGAIPSGQSVMAFNLIRLYHITGYGKFRDLYQQVLTAYSKHLKQYAAGYAMLLNALEFEVGDPIEIVIAAKKPESLLSNLYKQLQMDWNPNMVFIGNRMEGSALDEKLEFLKYQKEIDGNPTFYVCRNQACEKPVTEIDAVKKYLSGLLKKSP